jgi:Fe-S cluster biogenesis protein NfuA
MAAEIDTAPSLEQRVNDALEKIRPAIAGDGGDVWLVKIEDNVAYVEMVGACGGCAMSTQTLKLGIEHVVREDVPEILAVEQI